MNKYFLLGASALLVNQVSYGMREEVPANVLNVKKIENPKQYLACKPGYKLFACIVRTLTGKNIYEKNNTIDHTKIDSLNNTPIEDLENNDIFQNINLDELDMLVQKRYHDIITKQGDAEEKNVQIKNLKKLYKEKRVKLFSNIAELKYDESNKIIQDKFADLLSQVDSITNERIVRQTVNKEHKFRKNYAFSSLGSSWYQGVDSKKIQLKEVESKPFWQKHGGKVLLTGATALAGTACLLLNNS